MKSTYTEEQKKLIKYYREDIEAFYLAEQADEERRAEWEAAKEEDRELYRIMDKAEREGWTAEQWESYWEWKEEEKEALKRMEMEWVDEDEDKPDFAKLGELTAAMHPLFYAFAASADTAYDVSSWLYDGCGENAFSAVAEKCGIDATGDDFIFVADCLWRTWGNEETKGVDVS